MEPQLPNLQWCMDGVAEGVAAMATVAAIAAVAASAVLVVATAAAVAFTDRDA